MHRDLLLQTGVLLEVRLTRQRVLPLRAVHVQCRRVPLQSQGAEEIQSVQSHHEEPLRITTLFSQDY